jgi:hypothetical protein
MCRHVLADADHDGYAPTSRGACGTDCNDANAMINPGAVDVCGDGIDNDCDGMIDEGGITTYYADCDADGYAPMGTPGVDSCVPPSTTLTGCTGAGHWTTRAPNDAASSDCNDANPAVNPGQMTYQTTAIPGEPAASDYDYNCDGTETRQNTTIGACMTTGIRCAFTAGWAPGTTTGAVPECGASAQTIVGCTFGGCMPIRSTRMTTQACR